jgi:hypothetical protein
MNRDADGRICRPEAAAGDKHRGVRGDTGQNEDQRPNDRSDGHAIPPPGQEADE